jgi:hypothetical protein
MERRRLGVLLGADLVLLASLFMTWFVAGGGYASESFYSNEPSSVTRPVALLAIGIAIAAALALRGAGRRLVKVAAAAGLAEFGLAGMTAVQATAGTLLFHNDPYTHGALRGAASGVYLALAAIVVIGPASLLIATARWSASETDEAGAGDSTGTGGGDLRWGCPAILAGAVIGIISMLLTWSGSGAAGPASFSATTGFNLFPDRITVLVTLVALATAGAAAKRLWRNGGRLWQRAPALLGLCLAGGLLYFPLNEPSRAEFAFYDSTIVRAPVGAGVDIAYLAVVLLLVGSLALFWTNVSSE